ncbi:hypothetical protein J6590_063906 [Homalodisca vitripennis]|nr:hypothetical protein J6590_063906 [Homalodisca vitripennis]
MEIQAALMALDSCVIKSKLVWDCYQSVSSLARINNVTVFWFLIMGGSLGTKELMPWLTGAQRQLCYQVISSLARINNVTVCWVPGHKGIPGNERADALAISVNYDRPSTVLRCFPSVNPLALCRNGFARSMREGGGCIRA